MRDDTADDEGDAEYEPRQRVEVLIAANPGWRDMRARRARTVALQPRDVEEKRARPSEKAEG